MQHEDSDLKQIQLSGVCGKWTEKDSIDTIQDISFLAESGQLTVIVGPVGSGKSSIFNAILGEMPTSQGKIHSDGQLSYASQETWIFSGTLRQNILFQEPYDAIRYAKVLRVCDLNKDLQNFEDGDLILGMWFDCIQTCILDNCSQDIFSR